MSTSMMERTDKSQSDAAPEVRDLIAMQIAFKRVAKLRQGSMPGANPELGGHADIQNCLDAHFEAIRFGLSPERRLDELADVVAAAVVAMAEVIATMEPQAMAELVIREVA